MTRSIVLTGVLSVLSVFGCEEEGCSAVGCPPSLEARLMSGEPLADGTYRVDVTLDGETASCEFVVPDDPVGKICVEPSPSHVVYVETGFEVTVDVAAERVAIHVERDGAALADIDYEPEYRYSEPNGPECGPTCARADDLEVALSP